MGSRGSWEGVAQALGPEPPPPNVILRWHFGNISSEDLPGRGAIQRLVPPFVVVEVDPSADSGFEVHQVEVLLQVDVLVLQRAPEPLDHHVVDPAALAVHADLDALAPQQASPSLTRVLAALVRVHDLWPSARSSSCSLQVRVRSRHASIGAVALLGS